MSIISTIKRIEEKHHKEHVKRLTELIKTARTNNAFELAEFLINNGVCDKTIVTKIAYYFDD